MPAARGWFRLRDRGGCETGRRCGNLLRASRNSRRRDTIAPGGPHHDASSTGIPALRAGATAPVRSISVTEVVGSLFGRYPTCRSLAPLRSSSGSSFARRSLSGDIGRRDIGRRDVRCTAVAARDAARLLRIRLRGCSGTVPKRYRMRSQVAYKRWPTFCNAPASFSPSQS